MTCRTVSIHLLRVAAFLKEGGVKIPCSKPLPASFAASSWRRTRSGITGAPAGAGLANMIFFVKSWNRGTSWKKSTFCIVYFVNACFMRAGSPYQVSRLFCSMSRVPVCSFKPVERTGPSKQQVCTRIQVFLFLATAQALWWIQRLSAHAQHANSQQDKLNRRWCHVFFQYLIFEAVAARRLSGHLCHTYSYPLGDMFLFSIETCSLRQICMLYSLCALEGFQYVTCIGLVRLLVHRRICEWTVVGMFFPVACFASCQLFSCGMLWLWISLRCNTARWFTFLLKT